MKKFLLEMERRGRNRGNKRGSGPGGKCICPKCGYEKEHIRGIPCKEEMCPKCNIKMIKK